MKLSDASRAELIAIIKKKQNSLDKLQEKYKTLEAKKRKLKVENERLEEKKADLKVYIVRDGTDGNEIDVEEINMLQSVAEQAVQVNHKAESDHIEQDLRDDSSLLTATKQLQDTIDNSREFLQGCKDDNENDQEALPEEELDNSNLLATLQRMKDTNQKLWNTLLEILKPELIDLPGYNVQEMMEKILDTLDNCPKSEMPFKLKGAVFQKIKEAVKRGSKNGNQTKEHKRETQKLFEHAYAITKLLTLAL